MSWFLEDPTPTLVILVLIEAILVVALVKTGRGSFLVAIAGVAVVGVLMLAVEWFVVTDRESVEDALTAAARALESNDPQAVMDFIAPESPMRRQVAGEMGQVTIKKVNFARLDVKFFPHTSPPSAEADFMGYINANDRRGEFPYENFTGRFIVKLRQEGDRWVMTGYDIPNRPR